MRQRLNHPFLWVLLAIIIYGHFVWQDSLRQIITWLVYGLGFGLVLILLLGLSFGSWYLMERIKLLRATRIEAEKQAHVLVIQENGQIFIRDTDQTAIWRAAHLQQSLYANGHYEQPSNGERLAWQAFISQGNRSKLVLEGNLLPENSLESRTPLDLLAELDKAQRCLIVGASGSGKTTLLKHIVSRRLSLSQVVVIDPHAHPDKWPGCDVVGIGRNYTQIEYTLEALVDLMTKRYQEIGQGLVAEEAHPHLTIIIDEWRAIVKNAVNASYAITALLTESRKAAFSVFVGTHSERVKALGIEGEGDLKDGFVLVRLGWQFGLRYATVDYGDGELPANLPGLYIPPVTQMKTDRCFEPPTGPKPTTLEAQVLALHQEGLSISKIAQTVYGHKGKHNNGKVQQILSKFEIV